MANPLCIEGSTGGLWTATGFLILMVSTTITAMAGTLWPVYFFALLFLSIGLSNAGTWGRRGFALVGLALGLVCLGCDLYAALA